MIDDQSKGDIIMLGRKSTIVLHSDCTQHTTPLCTYIYGRCLRANCFFFKHILFKLGTLVYLTRQNRLFLGLRQCCQLWLFIAKWAIFGPCELAIFGKNIGYSQLFGLFLGRVWLFRLFYNMLAIFRLLELATLLGIGLISPLQF